jgi:hypothetical protein
MTIQINGTTGVTFPDSTLQATAYKAGSTDNTYTSGATNFTLTATSTATQRFLLGGSNPTNPSVTLPNATTLQEGNIFTMFNSSSYNPAIKDAGGTIREFLPSTSAANILLFDNSTSNGVWATSQVPICTAAAPAYDQTITGYKVGAGTLRASTFIRISATEIVQCWSETNGTTVDVYAQLHTLNTTTNQLTAGNRITLQSCTSNNGTSAVFSYDCDNAGHALLFWAVNSGGSAGYTAYASYAGLSVSGGTLYASTTTTQTRTNVNYGCCGWGSVGISGVFIGYLGSNDAYGLSFLTRDSVLGNPTQYFYPLRVTGTTTVTVTLGTGGTSISIGGNSPVVTFGCSRTSLTTFTSFMTCGGSGFTYRAFTFTPSTNTAAIVTRSVGAFLAAESGSIAANTSFSQGGFAYNNAANRVLFKNGIYDITNAGTANVTTALATSASFKPTFSTGFKVDSFFATPSTTLYTGGTQISVGNYYLSLDTTSSSMSFSYANVGSIPQILLSSTYGFSWVDTLNNSVSSGSINTRIVLLASPFIL